MRQDRLLKPTVAYTNYGEAYKNRPNIHKKLYPSFHKPLFSFSLVKLNRKILRKNRFILYFKKFFTHCENVNPNPPSILREGMSIPISTNARQLYEIKLKFIYSEKATKFA